MKSTAVSWNSSLRRSPMGEAKRASYIAEKDFQSMVEDLAALRGWTTWHVNLPMRSPFGFPDLVMFKDRIVFAELKSRSPKTGRAGKLAPAQIEYAHIIQKAGGEYVTWLYPDDWNAVCEFFGVLA